MPRRKILFVIPTLDPSGAEKQLTLLATHLPRDRYEPAVIALTRGGPFEEPLRGAGIDVMVLKKRLAWDPLCLARLTAELRRRRPDLVHTWLFAGNTYGRVAARLAGVRRVVASERCVDSWKAGYQLAIDRWLARGTDRIVVNTEAVGAFYRKAGIASEKLLVIANAIEPIDPEAPAPDLRAELGLSLDAPLVGFVGRLWPQKRVHDLIWAIDVLRLSGREAHLAIIGEGPRRPALERFVRNIDIGSRVHFLGHRPDAAALLPALDLLVLPSQFEGMPNVVLEAMRAGRPVVATRIPGMDEVVADEVTGLLVPPRQPFEIARAIERLLADQGLRRRMGEAGRERALRDFSIPRMVDAHARLYDEILGKGGG